MIISIDIDELVEYIQKAHNEEETINFLAEYVENLWDEYNRGNENTQELILSAIVKEDSLDQVIDDLENEFELMVDCVYKWFEMNDPEDLELSDEHLAILLEALLNERLITNLGITEIYDYSMVPGTQPRRSIDNIKDIPKDFVWDSSDFEASQPWMKKLMQEYVEYSLGACHMCESDIYTDNPEDFLREHLIELFHGGAQDPDFTNILTSKFDIIKNSSHYSAYFDGVTPETTDEEFEQILEKMQSEDDYSDLMRELISSTDFVEECDLVEDSFDD